VLYEISHTLLQCFIHYCRETENQIQISRGRHIVLYSAKTNAAKGCIFFEDLYKYQISGSSFKWRLVYIHLRISYGPHVGVIDANKIK